MSIQSRKKDHVDLCVQDDVGYKKTTGFENYDFIHNALPELQFDDISTRASLLGREFSFPLFVSSMTGGYAGAGAVNEIIARFCNHNDLPFGVGSQRVMLENPEEAATFRIVREAAPDAFIAANIGGVQLAGGITKKMLIELTDCIRADAVIVHLNPLQELMQPEGDRDFRGVLDGIGKLVQLADVPVIVKETGAGISASVAQSLLDAGVSAIDVAGAGGTSWSRVENLRSGRQSSPFDDWGIPTSECLEAIRCSAGSGVELIASGGVRNSFDIAKSLCLGADFAASAQPVIKSIIDGGESALQDLFDRWKHELATIMCLLGTRRINELGSHHLRKRKG